MIIAEFTARNGRSPTYRQMAAGIGSKSISNVARLLDCLEQRGHITRIPHSACSLSLTPGAPVLGTHDMSDRSAILPREGQ